MTSEVEIHPSLSGVAALLGRWAGREQLEPTPWVPGGPADGGLTFSVVGGGAALALDYATGRDGATLFSMHAVLAPALDDGLLWWWWDSAGHPPLEPATATWDDDTLTITKRTERGDSRTALALAAPHRLEQTIELRLAGDESWTPMMAGSYALLG